MALGQARGQALEKDKTGKMSNIVQYWQDVDARGGQDDQGKEGARLKALESGKLVDIKTSDPKPII